jgi:hypothetical protein
VSRFWRFWIATGAAGVWGGNDTPISGVLDICGDAVVPFQGRPDGYRQRIYCMLQDTGKRFLKVMDVARVSVPACHLWLA